jgi:hypothetical protein|mmetsp:Transcript_35345/g.6380  ORF Transcript_35345/g.6380 Transcript_35345/m.6380 type:complete len:116 (+) Transcript_35345:409-756(+)
MRLEDNEEKLNFFDGNRIVTLSVLKLHREVHKRLDLDAGRYVIVPSTMNPGETGKFWLNIYFSVSKRVVNIYKSGDRHNTGEPILEEEEIDTGMVNEEMVDEFKKLVEYLHNLSS